MIRAASVTASCGSQARRRGSARAGASHAIRRPSASSSPFRWASSRRSSPADAGLSRPRLRAGRLARARRERAHASARSSRGRRTCASATTLGFAFYRGRRDHGRVRLRSTTRALCGKSKASPGSRESSSAGRPSSTTTHVLVTFATEKRGGQRDRARGAPRRRARRDRRDRSSGCGTPCSRARSRVARPRTEHPRRDRRRPRASPRRPPRPHVRRRAPLPGGQGLRLARRRALSSAPAAPSSS